MPESQSKTIIRAEIEVNLKEDFELAAKRNDRTMSQVLREFIRSYVEENKQQGSKE